MEYECKTIMLMLTENCNLACRYCYEHNKSNKHMDFLTAKSIITKEFFNLKSFKRGEIELFGGEAFIEFDLIKQIYDFVKTKIPYDIRFSTTTNGTLIDDDAKKWLSKHKNDFICTLSLDGTKAMHDSNRCFIDGRGTYDSIDISFFRNTWKNGSAKMTVSPETIPCLSKGIIDIESLGFYCMATYASGIRWDIQSIKESLITEMSKLVKYYSNNDHILCQMLNYDLKMIFYPIDNDFRYCGAGVVKKCYNINGDCYPCQGLASMTIGDKSRFFKDKNFLNFHLSNRNPCKQCKWIRLCRTCYAANYMETGNVEKNSSDICFLNRVSIFASSKIQFNRLMKKDKLNNNDKLTLKAIYIIQNEIMQSGL